MLKNLSVEIRKEVELNAVLRHPNIVTLMAFTIDKNVVCLVTEFVDGSNLDDVLFDPDCSIQLSKSNKLTVARDVSSALCFMHRMNIVHQDIKPANILVNRMTHNAKLCDFGLGHLRQARATSHSFAMGIVGTPAYMAPECLIYMKKGTAESDVWSVGCSFVELFTEQVIWNTHENYDLMAHILECMKKQVLPEAVESLESSYREVVNGCIKYNLKQRLSAMEIVDKLAKIYIE